MQAVIAYGGPVRIARSTAGLFLLLELALSVCLLLGLGEGISTIVAIALLALFAGIAGFHVLKGDMAECHCFGNMFRERLGWPVAARNLVLMALGLIVLVQTPTAFSLDGAIRGSQAAWPAAEDMIPLMLIVVGVVIAYLQAIRALGLELHETSTSLDASHAQSPLKPFGGGA